MDWLWDCLDRCVGNLLLISKSAAVELGSYCGNLRSYIIGKSTVFSKICQIFTGKKYESITKLMNFKGNNLGFSWYPPRSKGL